MPSSRIKVLGIRPIYCREVRVCFGYTRKSLKWCRCLVKFLIILIVMIGLSAAALHAYQKRNLLLQAALLSEGYTLSASMKARVSDYYIQNNAMPHDNQSADLPPARSIYGTSVKRVSVNRSGLIMVDFDEEIGRQSMLFTPSVSPTSGLLEWRCSSDSIDRKVLELLKPVCSFTAATNEGKLINAVANNQPNKIQQLLDAGADPDAVVNGNTALMLASKIGHVDVVKMLFDRGASVDNNTLNSERRTPLMVAINSDNADVVAYLLANGASVTRRDYKGLSALDHASNADRRLGGERYQLMVLARLNPNFAGVPQLKAANGRTEAEQSVHLERLYPQLSQAAANCHVQRLATLFREEGDSNPPEMVDGKPLITQIQKPGCSTKLREYVKTKSIYKKALSARFSAANKACDLKSVENMLQSDPNIDIVGKTRLHSHFEQAIYAGCSALVAFYIRDHGLSEKIEGRHLLSAIRRTPQKKQVAIVGALIVAGVDVNYRDAKGDTPLAEAISLEQPVVSKYLVDAGADVSAPTRNHSFPLIEASKKGYHHLALQLIQHGADINQRDTLGRTALVAAVAKGRRRLVDALLRAGADATLKDNDGINAIMLSESRNYRQIYSQLTTSAARIQ